MLNFYVNKDDNTSKKFIFCCYYLSILLGDYEIYKWIFISLYKKAST